MSQTRKYRKFYKQSIKDKKNTTPIDSNTNYRREMKLVPIMDYFLLQFDALKILGVRFHGGLYLTLIFFKENPQFFQQNY